MGNRLIRLINLAFLGVALWLVLKEVHLVGTKNLAHILCSTPITIIVAMLGMGVINYIILSGYDILALHYIGQKIPYCRVLKIAAISFAISNMTGHTYAAGGTMRYSFYVPLGVKKSDIVRLIIFETIAVFLGLATAFEVAIGFLPFEAKHLNIIPNNILYFIAICIFLAGAIYYIAFVKSQRPIKIGTFEIKTPSSIASVKQMAVGLADNITLFAIFYMGLYYQVSIPIPLAFTAFILAQSIGFMTQVPGGIGVFETAFLWIVPHTIAQKGALLSSLILFRVLYYFIPLMAAILYLGIRHLKKRTKSPSIT